MVCQDVFRSALVKVQWFPRPDTSSKTDPVAPVNDAPVIAKVPDQRVTEGQAFDWNLVATDTDQPAQTISYSLVTGPQGLAVSPSGRVTWRPLEEQGPATYTVTVRASDGISAGELTFQITVLEVNARSIEESSAG